MKNGKRRFFDEEKIDKEMRRWDREKVGDEREEKALQRRQKRKRRRAEAAV
jgi:hypothetical protein